MKEACSVLLYIAASLSTDYLSLKSTVPGSSRLFSSLTVRSLDILTAVSESGWSEPNVGGPGADESGVAARLAASSLGGCSSRKAVVMSDVLGAGLRGSGGVGSMGVVAGLRALQYRDTIKTRKLVRTNTWSEYRCPYCLSGTYKIFAPSLPVVRGSWKLYLCNVVMLLPAVLVAYTAG